MSYKKFLSSFVLAAAFSGVCQGQTLRGAVYDSSGGLPSGVYEISAGAGTLTKIADTKKPTGGAVLQGETYLVAEMDNSMSYYATNDFWAYDANSFKQTVALSMSGSYPYYRNIISGLCCDPADGRVYGVAGNEDRNAPVLYTYEFDPSCYDYTPTRVAPLDTHIGAMSFAGDGSLYGVSTQGGLYRIDKGTGAMEKIGDTGLTMLVDGTYFDFAHASACVHSADGMYLSLTDPQGRGSLWDINLSDASATRLMEYPASVQVLGLYLSQPEADPKAPARPTELELDFKPGELTGGVWFKAPGKSYGGDEITGNLDFRIYANGAQMAQGKVYVMSTRFVEFSVPEKGIYEVKVVVANSAGDSPAASITGSIGYPMPATPEVEAIVEKGAYTDYMRVEWKPVTTDVSGKPLEGEVTYRVIRYPGEVTVCEATTSTSTYDYTLSASTAGIYGYGVTAIANGVESEEGESQVTAFGHIEPPHSESFDDEIAFAAYSRIDADGDGDTWQWYAGETIVQPGSASDCDDWLISPPVRLLKGKFYRVSVDMKVRSSDYPGIFELKHGFGPDVADMTQTLIPSTEVSSESWRRYSSLLCIEGEGETDVNLGLHAMSERDGWWLHATRLNISAALSGEEPAAPEDFSVVPDIDGALKAAVSLTAPTHDISMRELNNLTQLTILRDGEEIYSVSNPGPGMQISFEDTPSEAGRYTYTASAVSDAGEGLQCETTVFVGMQIPNHPEEAYAYETAVPGEVTVVWKPVTTYEDGTPLNPDNVTYNIWTDIDGEDVKIVAGIKGASHTFTIMANPEEEQMMWQFGVTAETAAGENFNGAMTPYTPVGRPYDTPYEDSFANLECAFPYVYAGSDNLTYWDNASDKTFEDVKTQDADGGMLVMYGRDKGSSCTLSSGKISLKGLSCPMLTFWTYNIVGDIEDTNTIEIYINSGSDFTHAATFRISDFGSEGWHRVELPLGDYIGQSIQFRLNGVIDAYQMIHVDNLMIRDRHARDLEVGDYELPAMMRAGERYMVKTSVTNRGLETSGAARVVLCRDNEAVASTDIDAIPSDSRIDVELPYSHPADATGKHVFTVKVEYADDMNPGNNTGRETETSTIASDTPVIDDLRATYSDDPTRIELTWSAPDLDREAVMQVTETFDECEPWAREVGDWTFLDRDEYSIYCFSTWIDLPQGAPQMGDKESWWVLDASYEGITGHFSKPAFYAPRSGNQCLVSSAVYADDYVDKLSDDWAISPLLPGIEQTVTLWAKSMLQDAPEKFEFLYSTDSSAVEDFKPMKTISNVGWEWERHDFNLPAGTRHFAVRSRSRDCFMLMLDDVSYAVTTFGLNVAGYNVYRDGVRINDEPVAGTSFTDVIAEGDHPTYRVSTLFRGLGESNLSNPATPEYSAVDAIISDMEAGARYYNLQGVEVREPQPGQVLLRRLGETVAKVIVR